MKKQNPIAEVFQVFKNSESYFRTRSKKESTNLIIKQLLTICAFTFIYGVVMGSYHSFAQSMVAGIKVTILFLGALLVCFPSFFVIQQVLGSKLSLSQMIIIVLSGFVLISSIALSFFPIILFSQLTGGSYHFIQLLHVAIFLFSGFFGMKRMVDALKFACEEKSIYPQIGVSVFRVWIVILAFASIQLSWNLRPFLCEQKEEFKLFRSYEGNFYTAILYSIKQITADSDDQSKNKALILPDENLSLDKGSDSTAQYNKLIQ